jgi:hypothetical protein
VASGFRRKSLWPVSFEAAKRFRWAAHGAAAFGFIALAVLVSAPLYSHLDTHIPGGGAGDNVAFLWNFWWFRFVHQGNAPEYFGTHHQFAPYGSPLILYTHSALEAYLGAIALGRGAIVRAHNVLLIAGLAANGLATYALAYFHVRRALPSFLAGVAFATSAFVGVHLLGHFNLVHAWVVPLAVLAWTALAATPSMVRACAAGAATALVTYSDYYYLIYVGMFAAIWTATSVWEIRAAVRPSRLVVVERILAALIAVLLGVGALIAMTSGFTLALGSIRISATHARNPISAAGVLALTWLVARTRVSVQRASGVDAGRRVLKYSVVAALTFAVLILPLAIAAYELAASGDYTSQKYFWRSAPRGIDVATVALGNPMHAVFGAFARRVMTDHGINVIEQTAWLGVVPLVLTMIAVRSRATLGRDARRWLLVMGVFFVWSLGPSLSVAGVDTGVLLPQTLARYVPIVSNARVPGRAIVMVQLAACILSAMIVTDRRWPRVALAALLAVVLADGCAAPFPLYRLPPADRIDQFLASATGSVIELPVGIHDGFGESGHFDHRALVHQMTHQRPIVGGSVSRIPPSVAARYAAHPAYRALFDLSTGATAALPSDFERLLAADDVRWIVVNTDALGSSVRPVLEASGAQLVTADGTRELYRIE